MATQKLAHRTSSGIIDKTKRYIAPLLVAGALGLGGCKDKFEPLDIPLETGVTSGCMNFSPCKVVVKKGDVYWKITTLSNKFETRVVIDEVDGKGVVFGIIVRSGEENITEKFRVNYDGSTDKSTPNVSAFRNPGYLFEHIKIKVEKTMDPSIALISNY